MSETTVDERIAARKAREVALREQLEDRGYDGPHVIRQGGEPFMAMFGGSEVRYAICLTCAAMIQLDDHEARDDGTTIERGIRIHSAWHSA